jgi:WD40 repeat protein
VIAPLSSDGKVHFYNGSPGTVQLIADVSGYYLSGTPGGGGFTSVTPTRLLDTRANPSPLGALQSLSLPVAGQGPVPPAGVSAVALNVTVVAPTSAGYITVWGNGANRPEVSNLNFVAGQTVPNLVIAPVASDGTVQLYNGSYGSVQLIVDVSGYFLGGTPAGGGLVSLSPARLLDTRDGTGLPYSKPAAVGPLKSLTLQVGGVGSVPSSGVSAVVLNVTAVAPTAPGYITVWGDGVSPPVASNLNFTAGQTVPNLVVVPVSSDGTVHFYNGSGGTVQLIADIFGYVLG